MTLKNVIRTDVEAIVTTGTVKEAAALMYQNHVGSVVVIAKLNGVRKTPVGIITDRDIALSLGKNKRFDSNFSVLDVMTPNVVVCTPEDSIHQTIQKMCQNGIRRIPVVNNRDDLVGIVTSDDLLKHVGEELKDLSRIISSEIGKENHMKQTFEKEVQLKSYSRATL
ncbi:MAG: CBS domain-containing protein [Bacteriovoracaceae bacterium]|jgi:CBS domain-containing protein|nr:CBS domain-containing protein [Bacteriovoracaceae bacterium]